MVDVRELTSASVWARLRQLHRYFRSPKGYLTIALTALAIIAAPASGVAGAATMLFWGVAGATVMELLLVRYDHGIWRFPSSALLTGMIVGMILGPHEPWYAAATAGILATDAKHVLRLGRSHVFNPAAFGLMGAYMLFGTEQSWWGALPSLPLLALSVLLVAGYLVSDRANKLPAALGFLGVYFTLFSAASLLAGATTTVSLNEIFRAPLLNSALFFAFFMVTDPPTSPNKYDEQLIFSGFVAITSSVVYLATRGLYYLPLGLLAGNGAYALWREVSHRRIRSNQPAVRHDSEPAANPNQRTRREAGATLRST